jgi:hypothetical protein
LAETLPHHEEKQVKRLAVFCFSVVAMFSAVSAPADILSTYGDVTVVPGPNTDPAWLITSSPASSPGYGGLQLQITDTLTPDVLTNLLADYLMTAGTFNNGAPRFTLFDDGGNSAFIYWGDPQSGGSFTDPNTGATDFNSTGNLADASSSDLRVESNGFGGLQTGPLPYITYQTFLNDVGTTDLSYITLDLDGGYSLPGQQMEVQNFTVNDTVYNPSPIPEPRYQAALGLLILGCVFISRWVWPPAKLHK